MTFFLAAVFCGLGAGQAQQDAFVRWMNTPVEE